MTPYEMMLSESQESMLIILEEMAKKMQKGKYSRNGTLIL